MSEEASALHSTMDAGVWADAFCRTTGFADKEWALGWFANAIMAGYDEAARRAAHQAGDALAGSETLLRSAYAMEASTGDLRKRLAARTSTTPPVPPPTDTP